MISNINELLNRLAILYVVRFQRNSKITHRKILKWFAGKVKWKIWKPK